jgi:hypothetical protein
MGVDFSRQGRRSCFDLSKYTYKSIAIIHAKMVRTRSKHQELHEEDLEDLCRKKRMAQSYNRVQQEEAFK